MKRKHGCRPWLKFLHERPSSRTSNSASDYTLVWCKPWAMNAMAAIPTAANSSATSIAGRAWPRAGAARRTRFVGDCSRLPRKTQVVLQQCQTGAELRILLPAPLQRLCDQDSGAGEKKGYQGRDQNDRRPVGTGLTFRRQSFVYHLNDHRILRLIDASGFQLFAEELVQSFVILQITGAAKIFHSA